LSDILRKTTTLRNKLQKSGETIMNFRQLSERLSLFILFCLFGAAAFAQTRKPFAVPFVVSNNVVLMQVNVNGSKPLSFIL
jgi:hypothetical protein